MTVDFWWDIRAGRFFMLRGIFDGFYPIPVDVSVLPHELRFGRGELVVVVATPDDVKALADALKTTSDYCVESYRHMRL